MNFGGLDDRFSDRDKARFVVLPVPYDLTSTYQPGSRRGPLAILEASGNMELYDEELDRETCRVGIHTLDPLEIDARGPAEMIRSVKEAVADILEGKQIPVILGGEHSISYGALLAVRDLFPRIGVLQLDAHADLREEYQGSPYSHASVARRMAEAVPVCQVGIRSMSAPEAEFIRQGKVTSFSAEFVRGKKNWQTEITRRLPEDVYVTIDLDVLDPSVMPATGTPEPGGISWQEILILLREVARKKRIVGFDAVELAPIPGLVAPDFLAAKLVYRLMGYLSEKDKD